MGADAMWTTSTPHENGWYLWKRSKTIKGEASWRAIYVELDYVGMDCWEGGVPCETPTGGWWARITPPQHVTVPI